MKVLLLCGVFHHNNQEEVVAHARKAVEFSANVFQEKLIDGFKAVMGNVQVLSAPFIGSYPNASAIKKFKGFLTAQDNYEYVHFNNFWGLRNLSRTHALKKAVQDFVQIDDKQKLIVVYSAHTPFLAAAAYAKKKDPRIRICFYVPDLPEYMNLSTKRSRIYDAAKVIDICIMKHHMKMVDCFVLLTEHMKQCLPIGDKPYLVQEGIVDCSDRIVCNDAGQGAKYIVYTGKTDKAFGIQTLLSAFSLVNDASYRLVICGAGDAAEMIRRAAAQDNRILYMGQVLPETALYWQEKATVLVNPRRSDAEYTKYSFPSKNIEYLLSGKPVVAYVLDGIPSRYEDFFFVPSGEGDRALALAQIIVKAAENQANQKEKYLSFVEYAKSVLSTDRIAERILELSFGEETK